MLTKRSNLHFVYPPNIEVVDLASLVQMYRNRGEIITAKPGEFLGCALTHKLIKQGKSWFGLVYSQEGWDRLITNNSGGYPLTDVELNILGMIKHPPGENIDRDFIESHSSVPQKMAYLIINGLKQFGLLIEEDFLELSIPGAKALDGLSRRIYEKNFIPEMLTLFEDFADWYRRDQSNKKNDQIDLF